MTLAPGRTVDTGALLAHKADTTVTVCLPAHDEAATVGDIVAAIRTDLVRRVPLVDDIVVLDDHSGDATAEIARAAGARVIANNQVLAAAGSRRGKGEALWKSLASIHTDVIMWIDADIVDFGTHFVTRLLEPLLGDPDIVLVKGHYERPVGAGGLPGGRVTELVARPALSLYFPHLTVFPQPLSGEIAVRRAALSSIGFAAGYGVDVGLLIDVAARYGLDRVALADLGVRIHRNRPLSDLAPQAYEVLGTILRRAGVPIPPRAALRASDGTLLQGLVEDRPPLDTLPDDWADPAHGER